MISETGRGALDLAAHGIFVFPVPPGTKRSYVAWGSEATTDPAVIDRWYSRWPLASVGAACRPSGLVVVDVDGPAGASSWFTLLTKHPETPATWTVTTGRESGGRHFWFRAPDGVEVPNSAGRVAPGIDIRGNVNAGGGGHGGMVVAPPSLHHSGRRYEWGPVQTLAALPEWVRALAAPPKPVRFARPAPVGASPNGLLASLVQVVMDGIKGTEGKDGIPGDVNNRLYWAACRAGEHVDAGRLTKHVVVAALTGAAEAKNLPTGEAARTIQSGLGREVRA
ncbi:bifunctional DNA primase/polymerase [Parafrankia sp. BMG5.11]|uniref:bifunctional DNA primase/polymerase n=1 Tax=Parafrankia sp. BMG5.11 TaxID=222540 RepID=UPI00103D7E73|nr:bifunctional DNA primase/polymerase [Parafrankia sp. BMG5.11]TCJ36875.1 bifunctional DNA primase/polymerase [Parafrankia sp. BMG5.11]